MSEFAGSDLGRDTIYYNDKRAPLQTTYSVDLLAQEIEEFGRLDNSYISKLKNLLVSESYIQERNVYAILEPIYKSPLIRNMDIYVLTQVIGYIMRYKKFNLDDADDYISNCVKHFTVKGKKITQATIDKINTMFYRYYRAYTEGNLKY
jgi:hypothetical protein